MGDDELEALRKRRMEQLQSQQNMDPGAMNAEIERKKREDAQIHMMLMQILEPEARERLNTIKLTRPEFAQAVEQQLVMLAQSGRLKGRITDDMLKSLLRQIMPEKKDYTIKRR